jgi:predicted outer membrane repeat protein
VIRGIALVVAAFALLSGAGPAGAALCFVDGNAAGGSGGSWNDAYKDLQSALANVGCSEIWVAKFVYRPSTSNVSVSFNIRPGAAVYGGFAGTEAQREQRSPAANLTVLSGDIDGNDCGGSGCANGVDTAVAQIAGGNSRHVVVMDGTGTSPVSASTVLDGFTITAGDAVADSGGGLYCHGEGAGKACSPMLAHLVFSGNRAANIGGALFNLAEPGGVSSPQLSDVTFRGNAALQFGGAIYNDGAAGGTSSPVLANVTFEGNNASLWGGAMFNDGNAGTSSPTLSNVTFSDNYANAGGAIYNEGSGGASSPTLTNVTFSGNGAQQQGGAMFNDGQSAGVASPALTNVTFNGNSAGTYGGAISSYGLGGSSSPTLTNAILWGDSASSGAPEVIGDASIAWSIVQGGCPSGVSCSKLVAGDPRLGPLRNNGGGTATLLPGSGSAAIDAGDDANCPATDQRGIARPQGAHCDVGAVESDRIFAADFEATP